jgi:soluble lytic murein transglycosylase-like protein
LLTKRTQKLSLAVLATAAATGVLVLFVTGATAQSEPRVGVSDAAAVELAPLQRPVAAFASLVHAVAAEIRAGERRRAHEKRAAAARERRERFAHLPGGVTLATLESIASCESGGDPAAVSSDGTYRGKYQFDYGTWESVGGHGDPADAPADEQDYRAALLYSRSGSSPWPVCG